VAFVKTIELLLKFEKQVKVTVTPVTRIRYFPTPPNKFEGATQISLVIQRSIIKTLEEVAE
jgi:hypothetical protein